MKKAWSVGILSFVVLLALFAEAVAAPAGKPALDEKAVADFYRGRTIRIVVGFSPGGGFDTYSRAIARHLGKYIPGHPTLIVENMTGAGSIIAANHVFNAAPKDGTVIGNISGPIILEQLFGNPGAQFDMARFRFLAVPVSETYLMIVTKKSGVSKLQEMLGSKGKQVTFGGIPGSTVEHAPALMRDVIGANIKLVLGYKGTSAVRLAIDSGEVDGFFNTWTSAKITSMDKFKTGEWLVLAQMSDKRLPDLPSPNVPTIPDIAKNAEHRQILLFGTSVPNQFGKSYAVAPGVPPDRAAALEAAFARTFEDAEFLADAKKGRLEISPLYGDEIQKLVVEFLGMRSEVRSKLQKAMKPGKK